MSGETVVVHLNDQEMLIRVNNIIVPGVRVMGGVPGPRGISELALTFPIELYVGPGVQPLPITRNMRIVRMLLAISKTFPPLGADLIFDVLKNGVSITVNAKPTILDGETIGLPIIPDDTEILAGDVLTVDILQVGSIQPGSYATLVLEVV